MKKTLTFICFLSNLNESKEKEKINYLTYFLLKTIAKLTVKIAISPINKAMLYPGISLALGSIPSKKNRLWAM